VSEVRRRRLSPSFSTERTQLVIEKVDRPGQSTMSRTDTLNRLLSIDANATASELRIATQELMHALLAFGSETLDNFEMAAHLEIGSLEEPHTPPAIGMKIKNKAISISSILNTMEDMPLPKHVSEAYPDLNEAEWSAALRFTTLILIALEKQKKR
jgi:hypothetical protein